MQYNAQIKNTPEETDRIERLLGFIAKVDDGADLVRFLKNNNIDIGFTYDEKLLQDSDTSGVCLISSSHVNSTPHTPKPVIEKGTTAIFTIPKGSMTYGAIKIKPTP